MDESCFNLFDSLYGLKHHRAAQRGLINWADINHRAYLDEYLLNAQQRTLDENAIAQVKSLLIQDEQSEKRQLQQHNNELEKFISQTRITPPVADIYREIFDQLQVTIEEMSLSDVLLIAKKLQIKEQWHFKVHFEQPQAVLIHSKTAQKLSYWRRELLT